MHSPLETIDILERGTAYGKGWIKDKYLVGRLISYLQPSMILNIYSWFAVPTFHWLAFLVDFPSGFEKWASPEDDFPAKYFSEGDE